MVLKFSSLINILGKTKSFHVQRKKSIPNVTVVDFTNGNTICSIILKTPAPSMAAASHAVRSSENLHRS